jgi:HAD superfamily hydrolase (TIGR01450 family)
MRHVTFRDVATRYKAIFFDAYGVLKNHQGVIPGIPDMFEFLKAQGIHFFVVTNDASRSPELLTEVYQKAGIRDMTPDRIISSGMLALQFLQAKVRYGAVAYLGPARSAHYVETEGLKTISIRDVDLAHTEHIAALSLLDDEGFDWEKDLNKTINLLRKQNMPVVVANTDTTYPESRDEVAIAIGGLSDMIERVVRKVFIRFGKPDSQIFQFALEQVRKELDVQKSEILMVGDTLNTDILGGNKFGIDTMLVLTGNTQPHRALPQIESTGIIPDYICESVAL